MPQITKVKVSILRAALPSLRQEKAFLVSLGGTTLQIGETAILRSVADLKAIQATTTTANELLKVDGEKPPVAIPIGTTKLERETGAEELDKQFTAPDELADMVNSWFANSDLAVSVIECGATKATTLTKTIRTDKTEHIQSNNSSGDQSKVGFSGTAVFDLSDLPTLNGLTVANFALDNQGATLLKSDIVSVSECDKTATIFFAYGGLSNNDDGDPAQGDFTVTLQQSGAGAVIGNFLQNYPEGAYCFILPRGVAQQDQNLIQLANNNAANDSQLYFIFTELFQDDGKGNFVSPLIPTGGANPAKSVILASGEVAEVGSGQHLGAAIGSQFLGYKPTAAQKLTGLSYRELIGITPMDSTSQKTQAQTATMDAANVNYPYAASTQGSARGTILFRGLCLNGDGAEQWYGTDFTAINAQAAVNNAIIEGNQPGNTPVGYDPFGVRALKNAAQISCNNDLAVGVATIATVTAQDLATYLAENPNDYAKKTYNGLTLEVTPFESIRTVTINLKADFSGASLAA